MTAHHVKGAVEAAKLVQPAHTASKRQKPTVQVSALRPAIPFAWVEDFRGIEDDSHQLVEGLISHGAMSVCYGDANSGKTYLVMHLCYRVSRGEPFFGCKTNRSVVVYIAGEGAISVRRRVTAFEKHHGQPFGRFGLISTALNLMEPSADIEAFLELVTQKVSEIGEPVGLIVVDTVARAMGGANENASEDMARLVAAGDRIRAETGAHVLFIHHSGKNAAQGARGHSSLRAAVDTEIEVKADEATKIHTAHITKQRDLATKGRHLAGRFVSVDVGKDQWGGVVTACAVDDVASSDATYKPSISGPIQQAVMAYLAGKAVGVRRAEVVKALEPQGISRATTVRSKLEQNQLVSAGW